MKFKRRHNRNGRQFEVGDQWTGDIDGGRFLYHRGILEPDGHPMDGFVTSAKPVRGATWSGADTFTDANVTSPADAAGGQEQDNGNS